jgi:hypothetical protein
MLDQNKKFDISNLISPYSNLNEKAVKSYFTDPY